MELQTGPEVATNEEAAQRMDLRDPAGRMNAHTQDGAHISRVYVRLGAANRSKVMRGFGPYGWSEFMTC